MDLRETKEIYGRFRVLAKLNRDIDQKNAIGNYEFTLMPGALFAPDGYVLPCNDKSKLIHCLENLKNTHNETHQSEQTPASGEHLESKKISTVNDLSRQFNEKLLMWTADLK